MPRLGVPARKDKTIAKAGQGPVAHSRSITVYAHVALRKARARHNIAIRYCRPQAKLFRLRVKTFVFTASAAKQPRIHGNVAKRIMQAAREYAMDGKTHANAVTQLVGSKARRLRVGEFRVIFEEDEAMITMTKIGPRGGVCEDRE